MATPRVFISSTCYDLTTIRENLEKFIESLGYMPIRSERGSIYFDTSKDVMDSCIDEITNCQMLVSIIGGRFGSEYKDTGKSITNMEVYKAREIKVPIFTLVDNKVLQQYEVWKINKGAKINYPNVQSPKIFEFIEEVKNSSVNNALQPFDSFEGIRSYLLQQWSGMMYNLLKSESQAKRVDETLSTLKQMNEKIEIITKQILEDTSKEKVSLVELKIKVIELISKTIKDDDTIQWINDLSEITPKSILLNETFEKFLYDKKLRLTIEKESYKIKYGTAFGESTMEGMMTYFNEAKKIYSDMHEQILKLLKEYKISKEDYLSGLNK